MECYFQNKFSVSSEYVRDYQLFEKGFHNYYHEFAVGYNTEEWSATTIEYQWGKNFDKDFWMIIGSSNIKFSYEFSVEYELRKLRFKPDPEDESTWLSIATFNYQFKPDLYLRLFTQYRSATDRVYAYALLGWRFKLPNSALYLVYTRDDSDRPDMTREKNEIVFLKLAYDFAW